MSCPQTGGVHSSPGADSLCPRCSVELEFDPPVHYSTRDREGKRTGGGVVLRAHCKICGRRFAKQSTPTQRGQWREVRA
jgi:hypothetical protein